MWGMRRHLGCDQNKLRRAISLHSHSSCLKLALCEKAEKGRKETRVSLSGIWLFYMVLGRLGSWLGSHNYRTLLYPGCWSCCQATDKHRTQTRRSELWVKVPIEKPNSTGSHSRPNKQQRPEQWTLHIRTLQLHRPVTPAGYHNKQRLTPTLATLCQQRQNSSVMPSNRQIAMICPYHCLAYLRPF